MFSDFLFLPYYDMALMLYAILWHKNSPVGRDVIVSELPQGVVSGDSSPAFCVEMA